MEKEKSSAKKDLPNFEILKPLDPDFDHKTCFENKPILEENSYVKENDYYIDSYSHFSIHEEMLKDRVRTLAYQNAIMKNGDLFKGKTVLDIGCGTGILSIFAAKAGAQHVYGVEFASIAHHAKKIIEDNKLQDRITIIKGKVEEITLPVDGVDIIISEWMGYFLLYESMFDTVLYARDKWLKKGGRLFPDRASIYLASIEDEDYKNEKIHFWDNVYSVNMSSIKKWAMMEPLVDRVDSKMINSNNCPIFDINLETVKKEELDFSVNYSLKMTRLDYVHALVAWFDVHFSGPNFPIRLTTSPFSKETHWKQTVFYIQDVLPVFKGDELKGSIAVKKNKENPRELDIKISFHLTNEVKDYHKSQYYRMS